MTTEHDFPSQAPTKTQFEPAWSGHAAEDFDLVLEGGAMRGLFTAGVLDFFMEKGLFAKHAIGTSAGALCGYNYVSGEIGRTALVNMTYCSDPRYLSMVSFARTGDALGEKFVFDTIPNQLMPFSYESFFASPTTLISVASDLDQGDADYHAFDSRTYATHDIDTQYLRASSAMPLVSRIVEVDGKRLLDGGICDSVPYVHSMALGTRKQVVVLTQHAGYVKKPNKLMGLANRRYQDFPLFLERMANRHYEYNLAYRRLARLHAAGDVFVIRPAKPVTVATMETSADALMDLYQQGYYEAAVNWERIQRYLGL